MIVIFVVKIKTNLNLSDHMPIESYLSLFFLFLEWIKIETIWYTFLSFDHNNKMMSLIFSKNQKVEFSK